jgi:xanthine/uracil/vitamin C permease (AzgA family)
MFLQEFNELSCSMSQKIRGRSNLVRTSLTGLSTGIAALCSPFLAAPVATLTPILLDKPLLLLCTRLMKKYSKKDWVIFFSQFKQMPS